MDPLHPIEVRVLGSLLEKDITTPEYYPLTLHALVNACNQKSSRDPVVQYDDDTLRRAIDSLREKGWAAEIGGAGHRVEKYAHRISEKLNLGRRELALVGVLMLRGIQTVGELRGRSERMYDFGDLDEVETCLRSLLERGLVAELPRGRWAHLLSGLPEAGPEPARLLEVPEPNHEARISALEREVEILKQELTAFRKQFE